MPSNRPTSSQGMKFTDLVANLMNGSKTKGIIKKNNTRHHIDTMVDQLMRDYHSGLNSHKKSKSRIHGISHSPRRKRD